MSHDDPERYEYESVAASLWDQLREAYRRGQRATHARLGNAPADYPALDSAATSTSVGPAGARWLRLLASDGTSWYTHLDETDVNIEFARQFGEMIVRTY